MDLTAQLDEELSFRAGDIITVLLVIDSEFCLGECNGQTGQFPVWCVDVIEGNLSASMPRKDEKRKSKFHKWWEEEGQGNGSGSKPVPVGGNNQVNSSHSPQSYSQTSTSTLASW